MLPGVTNVALVGVQLSAPGLAGRPGPGDQGGYLFPPFPGSASKRRRPWGAGGRGSED
jgi:hypothetical protein